MLLFSPRIFVRSICLYYTVNLSCTSSVPDDPHRGVEPLYIICYRYTKEGYNVNFIYRHATSSTNSRSSLMTC
nr:MAG TPA: hypothetical protein [Caudoviricetes sp.]